MTSNTHSRFIPRLLGQGYMAPLVQRGRAHMLRRAAGAWCQREVVVLFVRVVRLPEWGFDAFRSRRCTGPSLALRRLPRVGARAIFCSRFLPTSALLRPSAMLGSARVPTAAECLRATCAGRTGATGRHRTGRCKSVGDLASATLSLRRPVHDRDSAASLRFDHARRAAKHSTCSHFVRHQHRIFSLCLSLPFTCNVRENEKPV
jgi:hypothetical protein